MSFLRGDSYDSTTVVKLVAAVDIVQSSLIMMTRGADIVFRTMLSEEESLELRQNQSSTFVVIFFVVIVSFYAVHMTMALKLLSSLELKIIDPLTAARNAKVWQNWSIIVLVCLVGNLFASVLSADTKLRIAFAAVYGFCEIIWRLFGIYHIGLFIDEIIVNVPSLIPTVQFFAVRFPVPAYSRSLERVEQV